MATIRCPLNEAAHISMNESAIVSGDGALRFTETEQCVVATAHLLEGKGIGPGVRVGLLMRPGWQEVVLFWALLRVGATVCPLDGEASSPARKAIAAAVGLRWVVSDGSQEEPPGVELLAVGDLVGFTGRFKKEHRPTLELERDALVLSAVTPSGEVVTHTHTIASCYYAALSGNGVFPLRSSAKHHWALEPLHSFRGADALFRCAVAGVAVVAGQAHPPANEAINRLEITHLVVDARDLDALLAQLQGAETELTHVLVHGVPREDQVAALVGRGLFTVAVLGQPETGFYAVLDRTRQLHPMRHARLRTDDAQHLLVSGKTLSRECTADWHRTGLRCRLDPQQCLFLLEDNA